MNRRHDGVRDAWVPAVGAVDPWLDVETEGLLSGSKRRPADLLTAAAPGGGLSALDFGVASPHAVPTDRDCLEVMHERKCSNFTREELDELEEQRIAVVPVVYSSYGRAHPAADDLLQFVSKAAATRHSLVSYKWILRRSRARIGMAIWNGAAGCVAACRHTPPPAVDILEGGDLGGDWTAVAARNCGEMCGVVGQPAP